VTDPYATTGPTYVSGDADSDGKLDVGETWIYSAGHLVTQAEIDSNGGGDGKLENTATAGSNETGPDTDDADVPVHYNPALNIIKDATVAGGSADAGETIDYTIKVENTGNDDHQLAVVPVKDASEAKRILKAFRTGRATRTTSRPIEVLAPTSAATSSTVTYRLPKGTYIAYCAYRAQRSGGRPHAGLGMVAAFGVR